MDSRGCVLNVRIERSRFVIHILEGYISNLFLIEYGADLLLFDTGAPADVRLIEDYCRQQLRCTPQAIKLAVVSHMHPDHAGGAAALKQKYGIPIAAYAEADLWYGGMGGFIQHKLDGFMMQMVARRNRRPLEGVRYPRRLKADFLLRDSDVLPIFEDWQVLWVPGHTLHDIALYHPGEKILYPGDLVVLVKGQPCLPLPVLFPEKMRESLQKLASLEVSTILLAHGPVTDLHQSADLFPAVMQILDSPPTSVMRRAYWMSIHPLEVKKELLRKRA